MATVVQNNSNPQQPSSQGTSSGLGTSETLNPTPVQDSIVSTVNQFNNAFGLRTVSTYAMRFTQLMDEIKANNEYLGVFRWGTVPGIGNEMGSAAYVAGQYKGHWLYGIIFFESGNSLRIKEDSVNRGQEDYYTITELFNDEARAVAERHIMATQNLPNLTYMTINSVPDLGKDLDAVWARQLMGQMMMGIFGRIAGFLGELKLRKQDRYNAQVAGWEEGSVIDTNAHAQRADFIVTVDHTPSNIDSVAATLLDTNQAQVYPRVTGTGFVNMRYTGQPVVREGVTDLKQLQAEIVVSLVDSQSENAMAPYERQLILLAAFAEIAAIGGWRELFTKRLNKQDRKFSRLAEYLSWGNEGRPDIAKIDGSREAIEGCLDLFAPREAALVVSHRGGNGLGGLTTLLSEIAVGKDGSLKQLLSILNNMSPRDQNGEVVKETSFTAVFARALREKMGDAFNNMVQCNHIVQAAVPTVSGVYTGAGQKRSFQDMDPIAVVTKFGDNANDVFNYLNAQSYSHREMDSRKQRIYMLKLAASLFGSKQHTPWRDHWDPLLPGF